MTSTKAQYHDFNKNTKDKYDIWILILYTTNENM
jgi:hypothetical protein